MGYEKVIETAVGGLVAVKAVEVTGKMLSKQARRSSRRRKKGGKKMRHGLKKIPWP